MSDSAQISERRHQGLAAILDSLGGADLEAALVARGVSARQVPAVACFINAVLFAVREPEQYEWIFRLLDEGIACLQLADAGAQAGQVDLNRPARVVDECVIGLIGGTTMEALEVLTNGAEKRQRTWLVRQAMLEGYQGKVE
ncbi:hypothetical protein ACQE3E_06515 [Methylomonas sp. MED-D]|uniref:hypothetical protein n=1 Tax=Methylomonas sp. MED-D TaxID=3418768 RepID=UPI003D029AA4